MVSPGLGSIPRTNSAAKRPGNRPRPHDRGGRRPRCPWQPRSRRRRPTPGTAAVSMECGEHRGGGHTASIRADREEGRRCPPTNTTSLLRATPRVCAQKGPTARFSSGAPPEPDQTIDLKARPHLTDHVTGVDCYVARRPLQRARKRARSRRSRVRQPGAIKVGLSCGVCWRSHRCPCRGGSRSRGSPDHRRACGSGTRTAPCLPSTRRQPW